MILTARRESNLEQLRQEILEAYPDLDIVVKRADLSVLSNVYQLYSDLREYEIETWINNAGFGDYGSVAQQDLSKITAMIHLNVEALTILSTLYVHDYQDVEGTQLINLSSIGGYRVVPNAVTYSATKFYVSAFTEGLANELIDCGAKLQAKVLAPAATQTEFGKVASDTVEYDYDEMRGKGKYLTSRQMADFLLELYDSKKTVGIVDTSTFTFQLRDPVFSGTETVFPSDS